MGKVVLIEDMQLKELNTNRTIRVYLPTSYDVTRRNYPVLYMHDGNGLFSGDGQDTSLGINDYLDECGKDIIVVGIDSTENRLNEMSPWKSNVDKEFDFGEGLVNIMTIGGEGFDYLDSIVSCVKPYIDTHFRTKNDRKHTMLAGCSMGGYISLVGLVRHSETFGIIGAMSSSIWFNEEALLQYINDHKTRKDSVIYLDVGRKENGKKFVDESSKVNDLLLDIGYKNVSYVIDGSGKHNDESWAKRFPTMLSLVGF